MIFVNMKLTMLPALANLATMLVSFEALTALLLAPSQRFAS